MTCPAVSSFNAAYLGKPGNLVKLPPPSQGITAPLTRAAVTHALTSGGTTTTKRRYAHRTYTLPWNNRDQDSVNLLLAFYLGSMGNGPFVYLDPGFRNLQDFDVSTMGAAYGSLVGWTATTGDSQPVYDGTLTPPFNGTGVLKWSSAVNGHYVTDGTVTSTTFTPNTVTRPYAVPYLPDQPVLISTWARTVSGTASAAAAALGATAAGGAINVVLGATTTLNTSWQQLYVPVPVGQAGWSAAATPYVSAGVKCLGAGAPQIWLAASQVEMGVALPSAWAVGVGTPRVTIQDPHNVTFQVWKRRTHGLVLTEV